MELANRVNKLLDRTRPLVATKRRAAQTSQHKGRTLEEIVDAVEARVAPADRHYLDTIVAQIDEYTAAYSDRVHGFVVWLDLIRRGISTLPERIPAVLLDAWVQSYSPARPDLARIHIDGRPISPPPFWRCMNCRLSLPHNVRHNWTDIGCPTCGSDRIFRADISKPSFGDGWIDPRPHPQSRSA
ncbi:MAG TPA: hypothetical protein VE999_23230 [Gemmataceae bacterium]|nr:hypothetical protein [Gemmataceae bacterium]